MITTYPSSKYFGKYIFIFVHFYQIIFCIIVALLFVGTLTISHFFNRKNHQHHDSIIEQYKEYVRNVCQDLRCLGLLILQIYTLSIFGDDERSKIMHFQVREMTFIRPLAFCTCMLHLLNLSYRCCYITLYIFYSEHFAI